MQHQPADVFDSPREEADDEEPPAAVDTSAYVGPRDSNIINKCVASSTISDATSAGFDADRDLPRPFAHGRINNDDLQQTIDYRRSSWKQTLSNMFANPGQWLMFADQAVPLWQQLKVVVIVSSFILYPSLCQASLSIFTCYKLDHGSGVFTENQQATWPQGYWLRNMRQECYTCVHERLYVPIGIASVILFCRCLYFLLTFLSRRQLDDPRTRIQYGFLYQQYKPKYYWWASMRQLQVLALVAVEVFGRALPVLKQPLLLLALLRLIAAVNIANSPERFSELFILEFLSMCVLSLTLTLSLYFVADDAGSQLDTTSANVVGSIILAIHAVFILAVLIYMAKAAPRQRER